MGLVTVDSDQTHKARRRGIQARISDLIIKEITSVLEIDRFYSHVLFSLAGKIDRGEAPETSEDMASVQTDKISGAEGPGCLGPGG